MPTPRNDSSGPKAATVPIIAMIAAMLALVLAVNMMKPGDRTTLAAVGNQASVLGFAAQAEPRFDGIGAAESPDSSIEEASPVALDPTATPVPTTAPVTMPTLAPAVPADATAADADGPERGTRAEVEAAAIVEAPTEAPTSSTATATPVPATPTAEVVDVVEPTAVPATATPLPEPTATPIPEPTATPIPLPTATPIPDPTPSAPFQSGASTAGMEQYVFQAINQVRARAGLPAVELRSDISAIARDWSAQMAAVGHISHRPQAQLGAMLPGGWRGWAENVAEAPTAEWAQSALEESPGHYANMTGDYNVVGVGVVVAANGQVFVTHNFAKY